MGWWKNSNRNYKKKGGLCTDPYSICPCGNWVYQWKQEKHCNKCGRQWVKHDPGTQGNNNNNNSSNSGPPKEALGDDEQSELKSLVDSLKTKFGLDVAKVAQPLLKPPPDPHNLRQQLLGKRNKARKAKEEAEEALETAKQRLKEAEDIVEKANQELETAQKEFDDAEVRALVDLRDRKAGDPKPDYPADDPTKAEDVDMLNADDLGEDEESLELKRSLAEIKEKFVAKRRKLQEAAPQPPSQAAAPKAPSHSSKCQGKGKYKGKEAWSPQQFG